MSAFLAPAQLRFKFVMISQTSHSFVIEKFWCSIATYSSHLPCRQMLIQQAWILCAFGKYIWWAFILKLAVQSKLNCIHLIRQNVMLPYYGSAATAFARPSHRRTATKGLMANLITFSVLWAYIIQLRQVQLECRADRVSSYLVMHKSIWYAVLGGWFIKNSTLKLFIC